MTILKPLQDFKEFHKFYLQFLHFARSVIEASQEALVNLHQYG
jgi:hypothetical protein